MRPVTRTSNNGHIPARRPRPRQLLPWEALTPTSVCPHCGSVGSARHLSEPGHRVLVRLARVGLGDGAPPLLCVRQGGR